MTPSDLIADSLPYIASHRTELIYGLAAFAVFMVLFAVAAAAWRGR